MVTFDLLAIYLTNLSWVSNPPRTPWMHGTAKLVRQKYNELLKWNTRIAERYMGRSNTKAYGKRNTTEGVILVPVKPTKIIAVCYR
jgi:hypothetical protein